MLVYLDRNFLASKNNFILYHIAQDAIKKTQLLSTLSTHWARSVRKTNQMTSFWRELLRDCSRRRRQRCQIKVHIACNVITCAAGGISGISEFFSRGQSPRQRAAEPRVKFDSSPCPSLLGGQDQSMLPLKKTLAREIPPATQASNVSNGFFEIKAALLDLIMWCASRQPCL